MEIATQNVLVVGSTSSALARIAPLLCRANIRLRNASAGEATALLAREGVDLLIVRLPAAGATLAELLAAAARAAARPRVLVLADEEVTSTVRPWLGRGVDRALSLDATSERLMVAVAELLPASRRAGVRVALSVPVRWQEAGVAGAGVTVNLSVAGMMVAGEPRPAVGAVIDFTLVLPRGGDIGGRGEVTRCGATDGDSADFAVRFVAFAGDGWETVTGLLAS